MEPSTSNGHKVRFSTTNDEFYDFDHANRGIALIFNQVNFNCGLEAREGSDKDCKELEEVLQDYGFEVRSRRDYTKNQILKELVDVSNEEHHDNDCFMCVVMTHGAKNDKIFAKDDSFKTEELWKNFVGYNCSSLIGKPKLFFIQACRGPLVDPGVKFRKNSADSMIDSAMFDKIPVMADLLMIYPTMEKHISFRQNSGTWFIQSLIRELRQRENSDIMTILLAVNRRVAYDFSSQFTAIEMKAFDNCKEMPNFLCTLTKNFRWTKKERNAEYVRKSLRGKILETIAKPEEKASLKLKTENLLKTTEEPEEKTKPKLKTKKLLGCFPMYSKYTLKK